MAGYLYGLCGFRGLLARAARGGGALARPEQLVALGGAQHRAYRLVFVRQDHPRIRRGHLEGVVSRAGRARRRFRRFAELLLILAGLSGNRFVPVSLRPIASPKVARSRDAARRYAAPPNRTCLHDARFMSPILQRRTSQLAPASHKTGAGVNTNETGTKPSTPCPAKLRRFFSLPESFHVTRNPEPLPDRADSQQQHPCGFALPYRGGGAGVQG